MDIEQSSEAGYEGSNNKKMKFSPSEKLCVIFDMVNDYFVFIVDLNNDNPGDGFRVLPYPLRFQKSIWGFCVVGATLYKFPYSSDDDDDRVVCSYNLNREFDLVDLETKAPDMLYSNLLPRAICYKSSLILIFSTAICFGKRTKQVNFELYDPEGRMSRPLPELCVARPKLELYRKSALWRSDINEWEEFQCMYDDCDRNQEMLHITSFSIVKGHTFVIKTDLGQQFSLNLESCEGWLLDEGGVLRCPDQTYVINENGVCLDGDGAYYNLKPEEVIPFEDAEGTFIDFAATCFGDRIERDRSKSFMTLVGYVDEGCPIMWSVQIGYDTSNTYAALELGYEISSKLYWSLELLSFDVSEFPADYEMKPYTSRDLEDDQRRLFKLIKSFKFCLDETFEWNNFRDMQVVGLYPF